MREILFRGKRTINGDWVYGDFVHGNERKSLRDSIFVYDSETQSFNDYKINPSTLGQYTGLTDKNGKRIFEGDIVKTDKFSEPNKQYIIKYDLQFGAFIGQDRYNLYFVTFDGDSGEFEVIGNIHDNPEILKGFNEEV